jgi:hypothetical protein
MSDSSNNNIKEFYFSDMWESDFVIYEETSDKVTTEVQTEIIGEDIDKLKMEIGKLKIENSRLQSYIKEICQLVGIMTKVNGDNTEIDIDKIKRSLTIMVNREIRQHTPIPYINIDYLSNPKKNDKIFIL